MSKKKSFLDETSKRILGNKSENHPYQTKDRNITLEKSTDVFDLLQQELQQIWITPVANAYEINADWFKSEYISCPKVLDNGLYEQTEDRHKVIFINDLYRNKIYQDFFIKMGAKYEANE